jgi:hypothetical protein
MKLLPLLIVFAKQIKEIVQEHIERFSRDLPYRFCRLD